MPEQKEGTEDLDARRRGVSRVGGMGGSCFEGTFPLTTRHCPELPPRCDASRLPSVTTSTGRALLEGSFSSSRHRAEHLRLGRRTALRGQMPGRHPNCNRTGRCTCRVTRRFASDGASHRRQRKLYRNIPTHECRRRPRRRADRSSPQPAGRHLADERTGCAETKGEVVAASALAIQWKRPRSAAESGTCRKSALARYCVRATCEAVVSMIDRCFGCRPTCGQGRIRCARPTRSG